MLSDFCKILARVGAVWVAAMAFAYLTHEAAVDAARQVVRALVADSGVCG